MSIKKGLWKNCSLYEYTPNISGVPPFTFKSDGENLRDWSMSGQTVQASTPTPSSPVDVSGVGERTENLFNVSDYSVGETSFITKQITLEPNTTYTMSSNCPLYSGGALIVIGNIGESFSTASNGVYPNHSITRTADANGKLLIGLRANGSDYTPADYETMLNAGSTALPYEPYGYKIPVNVQSGNLFNKSATYTTGAYTNLYTISGLDPSQQYTCSTSLAKVAGATAASIYLSQTTSASAATNGIWAGEEKTFTPNQDGTLYVLVRNTAAGGAPAVDDDVIAGNITIMLNQGTTPLPYQPYSNTTTNIYLGSVLSTRRIKKLVLTGEEDWELQSINSYGVANYRLPLTGRYTDVELIMSTHYVKQTTALANTRTAGIYNYGNPYFYIRDVDTDSVTSFKTFLTGQYANGTPVCVYYVLREPETAATNEPLMKIGSYADEITKTGTGVNIPTTNGSNTLTVGTTVQPSEMSIESISQWIKQN